MMNVYQLKEGETVEAVDVRVRIEDGFLQFIFDYEGRDYAYEWFDVSTEADNA